jgi:hypothetical protein
MTFCLPKKKKDKLLELCSKTYKSMSLSLREMASLLGILNWATQSLDYAPAHYRNLQTLYTQQSKSAKGDLSVSVSLSREAKSDLFWWINREIFSEGPKILISFPSILIFSDASLSG